MRGTRVMAGAVALAAVLVLATGCQPDDGLPQFQGKGTKTVAVIGDSIFNMAELPLWLEIGQDYASSVDARYGRVLDPLTDNSDPNPNNQTHAREVAATYAARRPDYVVLNLGVNDGNRFTFNFPNRPNNEVDASVAKAEADLESYMALFPDSMRCMVLVNVVASSMGGPSLQRWFNKWNNEVLPRVATRHPRVRIADWVGAVRGHESVWLRDTVHPSDEGSIQMARVVHASLHTCPA